VRSSFYDFRMLSPLMLSFTRIKVYCDSRAGKALLRTRLAKLPSAVSGGNSSESWKGTHRRPATPEDAGSRSTCCLVPEVTEEPGRIGSVHAFVHLAAQLVFSSEIIASQRLTNWDHCSAESAFTSPMLAISALSRRAVAR
jgi:hypothetical protein